MGDKPILFSGPMVRALLEGRKTQTRRGLKPQPVLRQNPPSFSWGKFGGLWPDDWFGYSDEITEALPYAPGDRLWVRETWADLTEVHGQKWEKRDEGCGLYKRGTHPLIWFRADGDQPDVGDGAVNPEPWKPSIFMPRAASRLTLLVTDVRVQRLQDISDDGCFAEGISGEEAAYLNAERALHSLGNCNPYSPEKWAFMDLWDSINANRKDKDGSRLPYAWDDNPWVVALTFDVIAQNIDTMKGQDNG